MSTAAAHAWQQNAACLGADPDLFFPPVSGGHTHAAIAKTICAGCPVKTECLTYAIEERIGYGIWGGLDVDERQAISPGRRRFPQPIQHGTNGGSRAHRRRGETPCAECKQAHALYHQMRKERRQDQ